MIQPCFTDSPDRFKLSGARPAETHLAELKKFDKEVDRWMGRFIERFFSHCRDSMQVEAAEKVRGAKING